ncbi:PCI-domain-containing protein [Myriangium duriaei CBS 260.36]|uniref:Eukaryotic translation initiation factor 3 subunit M n=1 Tax=Myriangium duriaei CBS 260.36 TaxID=1168546 RepID=A0A9P4MHA6_9PEZI|nr:PCI-domain-containing protein [Myriangium duriaei CBS 260.36]
MPAATNTLIVEGSFEELSDEFATYLDSLNAGQNQQSSVQSDVQPLLQGGKKEDALKKLVVASSVLRNAPEREFVAAYNQLVHLVRQAPKPEMFLAPICQNLSQPVTSSPQNSVGLQLNVLTTIFNTLPSDSESRYHVLLAILTIIRKSSASFDIIRPQLKTLDLWLQNWDMDKDDARKLYLALSDAAAESSDPSASYQYLLRALRTLQEADEASSQEAQQLSIRAIGTALSAPQTFDFSDLTALDSVQALRKSEANWFDLLEIFATETLDDYNEFLSAHGDWVKQQQGLDEQALETKMRLLTLTSLAASAGQTRTLPYASIAKALGIESRETEKWVIDVIRAGLVEGKLSQSSQTFLIHRATYRVFGEHQWREVSARLDMWKRSLEGVLRVLAEQKREYAVEKEREGREESGQQERGKGFGGRGGRGYQRGGREKETEQKAVEVE